jgi:hypothetical protein
MRNLRIGLVCLPPLLADLVQQAVTGRLQAEFKIVSNAAASGAPLAGIDVIIIGLSVSQAPAPITPHLVPTLMISADLAVLYGPRPNEQSAFTVDSLVEALRRIASDLDLSSPPFPDPRMDS